MSQKRSYEQYPKEFKDEAVALVLEQGYFSPGARNHWAAQPICCSWKEHYEKQKDGKVKKALALDFFGHAQL